MLPTESNRTSAAGEMVESIICFTVATGLNVRLASQAVVKATTRDSVRHGRAVRIGVKNIRVSNELAQAPSKL
jgi:hypothetical protein